MIKKTALIIMFFLFLISNTYAETQNEKWVYVKWVADGDTIALSDGRLIRYIGINAPEIEHKDKHIKAEPFGKKAKKANENFVLNKKVRLELDLEEYDRYGRLLAYVFLEDGTFVNKEMLSQGYAYFLYKDPNTKYSDLLLNAQKKAMQKKLGIWKNWIHKNNSFIGNNRSKRFHTSKCSYGKKISKKNKIIFNTAWDAFYDGFSPCKRCKEIIIQEFPEN